MMQLKKITDYPIAIEGSVKNIRVVEEPTAEKMGLYILEFTDDTSVKDFGKLGFKTPRKGETMCATAAFNFRQLEAMGIPTIYRDKQAFPD